MRACARVLPRAWPPTETFHETRRERSSGSPSATSRDMLYIYIYI